LRLLVTDRHLTLVFFLLDRPHPHIHPHRSNRSGLRHSQVWIWPVVHGGAIPEPSAQEHDPCGDGW
jgi:hypothetical protein